MLMKFSSAGTRQWTVLHGGSAYEVAYGLEAERANAEVLQMMIVTRMEDEDEHED